MNPARLIHTVAALSHSCASLSLDHSPEKTHHPCALVRLAMKHAACWLTMFWITTTLSAERQRPNIVFILADDLGWTDVACNGGDLYQTPNIDRLAREGLRFTDAYAACNVCSPTRAALMTGMAPARLHLTDYLNGSVRPHAKLRVPEWTKHLEHRHTTLAEALKGAGYATIHAGKWHLARRPDPANLAIEEREDFPDRHGFDVMISGVCAPGTYFYPWQKRGLDAGLSGKGKEGDYLTDLLTEEALRAVEVNRERPFFLYLAHFDVHTPIEAKPAYVEKYRQMVQPQMRHRNAVYAAKVQSLDESVGRVMQTLQSLGVAENTLIIFTSDNGGMDLDGFPTDNHPLRAGKGTAYEGGVRVPLIVKWPGVIHPGGVSHEPVITMDFFPTLLAAAEAKSDPAPAAPRDGVSLMPIFQDAAMSLHREALFWHYPHHHDYGAEPYGAVRSGEWRLVEFYDDMRTELYHLADDISETKDVSAAHPEVAHRLTQMLHDWRGKTGAQMPEPNPDHDPVKDAEEKTALHARHLRHP